MLVGGPSSLFSLSLYPDFIIVTTPPLLEEYPYGP